MTGRTRSRGAVPSAVKTARTQVLTAVTHYETLGVVITASPAEIKIKFRELASLLHPDRAGRYLEDASDLMANVNLAYACLCDAAGRHRYDMLNKIETRDCDRCDGRGVLGKTRGFSAKKTYSECPKCGGSGRVQPEQN